MQHLAPGTIHGQELRTLHDSLALRVSPLVALRIVRLGVDTGPRNEKMRPVFQVFFEHLTHSSHAPLWRWDSPDHSPRPCRGWTSKSLLKQGDARGCSEDLLREEVWKSTNKWKTAGHFFKKSLSWDSKRRKNLRRVSGSCWRTFQGRPRQ